MLFRLLIILIALTLPLATPGCSGEDQSQGRPNVPATPADGGAIVTGSIGDASNLIPYLGSDSSSSEVTDMVYDGLLKVDKNLNIIPNLAKSFQVSLDGKTVTFKLHENVRWQDGHPFTSADCKFTYEFVTDPKTPTPYAGGFEPIKKVSCPDDYTFVVEYKEPYAKALDVWLGDLVPKHLLEGVDPRKSPLARHPVGTGPYKLAVWEAGDRIELAANEDYFAGRPRIDRRITKIIPDMATQFLELKAGGLDSMGLTPIQFARQTDKAWFKNRFNKFRYPASAYTYLGYNLRSGLFKDRRVRQALSYAIDKQEIIDGVLLGLGQPAVCTFKPGTWAYPSDIKPYPFDPAKAKELLSQAGWIDSDNDGWLDKGGVPFNFTILTNQGNSSRLKTAIIIQYRLKQIGIKVKVRAVEWAAFLKEFIDKHNFDATILAWTLPLDPDPFAVWHSSKTGQGGLNFVGFRNKEVDELITEGRRTVDKEKRKKLYHRFSEILYEEQPYTFLYVPDALPVLSARVYNVKAAPAGIGYNFTEWYIPKPLQRYHYQP